MIKEGTIFTPEEILGYYRTYVLDKAREEWYKVKGEAKEKIDLICECIIGITYQWGDEAVELEDWILDKVQDEKIQFKLLELNEELEQAYRLHYAVYYGMR